MSEWYVLVVTKSVPGWYAYLSQHGTLRYNVFNVTPWLFLHLYYFLHLGASISRDFLEFVENNFDAPLWSLAQGG